ncbi:MAG TPA: DinB family protein [Flavobacteriales bacterium]|nr:DinB family protein [Flavobacteriales bacterium]
MTTAQHIAKHFKEVNFGGNWTWSNVKDVLSGITWEQSVKQVHGCNTIATLTFHMNYFVEAIINVLEGNALDSKDELSFAHPPITSQQDWDAMVQKSLNNAEKLTALIEKLPDSKLNEVFVQEKYGTYYRNLHGLIEHTHYHLGQAAIIKKIVLAEGK